MTKEDHRKYQKALLDFKLYTDCDEIRVKEKIKKMLSENELIAYALGDKEKQDEDYSPDEYFGDNILAYYLISEVQTHVKNFICYEVSYDMAQSYQYSKSHKSLNSTIKTLNIIFHILVDEKDILDRNLGNTPRHDLLAALIQDQFNWCNEFGGKLMLVSDVPSTVDKHYACRTLVFQQTTDNNIVKTLPQEIENEDGEKKTIRVPRFINKINDYRDFTYKVDPYGEANNRRPED